MFITKTEFKRKIQEAREEGYAKAWDEQHRDEQYRLLHELKCRVDKLEGKSEEMECVRPL